MWFIRKSPQWGADPLPGPNLAREFPFPRHNERFIISPMKLLFSLLALLPCLAIAGPESDAAKKQAQQCADASVAKDYDKVIAFTHPALIKLAGDRVKGAIIWDPALAWASAIDA